MTAVADTVSSIFAPVSTPAAKEADLARMVLVLSAVVFVVVGGLIAYSVVRFRAPLGEQGSEPPQVYGSAQVEAAWTAVPLIIILVLMLATGRVIHEVQAAPQPPNAVEVTVVGKQWWWEIRYPKLGVVTANELHVPVSDSANRRPTFLTLESSDVAHSFWVPRVAGKTDLIPNGPLTCGSIHMSRAPTSAPVPNTAGPSTPSCSSASSRSRRSSLLAGWNSSASPRPRCRRTRARPLVAGYFSARFAAAATRLRGRGRAAGSGRISPISCLGKPLEPASRPTPANAFSPGSATRTTSNAAC